MQSTNNDVADPDKWTDWLWGLFFLLVTTIILSSIIIVAFPTIGPGPFQSSAEMALDFCQIAFECSCWTLMLMFVSLVCFLVYWGCCGERLHEAEEEIRTLENRVEKLEVDFLVEVKGFSKVAHEGCDFFTLEKITD
ncbi:hypothetical protein V8E51_017531 [Hyaloscypha variabilis]